MIFNETTSNCPNCNTDTMFQGTCNLDPDTNIVEYNCSYCDFAATYKLKQGN